MRESMDARSKVLKEVPRFLDTFIGGTATMLMIWAKSAGHLDWMPWWCVLMGVWGPAAFAALLLLVVVVLVTYEAVTQS